MPPSTLDERTLEILRRDEAKFIQALEMYYLRFGKKPILTYAGAARKVGVNPVYLVKYIAGCEAEIGVPDTGEEAQTYLKNLQAYKLMKFS